MRILLDENLNWRLKRDLPGHQVDSVPLLGWAGIKNGELLRKAVAHGYDALITMDGNMAYQQDLRSFPIVVLVLRSPSNRFQDTSPLMPVVLRVLPGARKGERTIIEVPAS